MWTSSEQLRRESMTAQYTKMSPNKRQEWFSTSPSSLPNISQPGLGPESSLWILVGFNHWKVSLLEKKEDRSRIPPPQLVPHWALQTDLVPFWLASIPITVSPFTGWDPSVPLFLLTLQEIQAIHFLQGPLTQKSHSVCCPWSIFSFKNAKSTILCTHNRNIYTHIYTQAYTHKHPNA